MYYWPKKVLPGTIAIYGALSILLSCFIGFLSVKELAVLANEPQHMLISDAVSKVSEKPLWVILDDIQWDCDHVFYFEDNRDSSTYIVFTNKEKSVLGFALFGGKKDCKVIRQNEVAGVLDVAVDRKSRSLYSLLAENGFDIALHEKNGTLLSLCTYCGRENSLIGIILSVIFLGSGIFLFFQFVKTIKAQKNANRFMRRDMLRL